MRVLEAPKTILVTRPTLVEEGIAELLAEYDLHQPEDWARGPEDAIGDQIPELMGRLCYGSFGPAQGRVGTAPYIGNILAQGHGSVLEHACWGFVVCRAGRGYTHQMIRHRAGFAFSQESQHFIRYGVNKPESGEPWAPEAGVCLTGVPERLHGTFVAAASRAVEEYEQFWKTLRNDFPADAKKVKKIVSGTARGLLPNAIESRLGFTANARALRHFCELRGTPDNTPEIRIVAAQVAVIMRREAPAIFDDVLIMDASDGLPMISSVFKKV